MQGQNTYYQPYFETPAKNTQQNMTGQNSYRQQNQIQQQQQQQYLQNFSPQYNQQYSQQMQQQMKYQPFPQNKPLINLQSAFNIDTNQIQSPMSYNQPVQQVQAQNNSQYYRPYAQNTQYQQPYPQSSQQQQQSYQQQIYSPQNARNQVNYTNNNINQQYDQNNDNIRRQNQTYSPPSALKFQQNSNNSKQTVSFDPRQFANNPANQSYSTAYQSKIKDNTIAMATIIPNNRITSQIKQKTITSKVKMFDNNTVQKFFTSSSDPAELYYNSQACYEINCHGSTITDEGIKLLCAAPSAGLVMALNLSQNYSAITDQAIQYIVESPFIEKLAELNLSDTNVSDLGMQRLSQWKNASSLNKLYLYGCFNITNDALLYLAQSEYIDNLQILDLRSTAISDKGIQELLNSKTVSYLQELDISMNQPKITDQTLLALAMSETLRNLKVLKCAGNVISNVGIQYLCESENTKKLQHLDISSEYARPNGKIDDKALINMSHSNNLMFIQTLNLRALNITSRGMTTFLDSFNARQLRELRLSWNKGITDDVLFKVADSKHLSNIKKLFVNDTSVTTIGIEYAQKIKPLLEIIF